jgi:hypothetical protein
MLSSRVVPSCCSLMLHDYAPETGYAIAVHSPTRARDVPREGSHIWHQLCFSFPRGCTTDTSAEGDAQAAEVALVGTYHQRGWLFKRDSIEPCRVGSAWGSAQVLLSGLCYIDGSYTTDFATSKSNEHRAYL